MITLEELSKFVRNGKNAQIEIDRLCRTNNPQTSKDAAKKMVESGKLSEQEEDVYDVILRYNTYGFPDFTTKDIAVWLSPVNYDKAYDICRKRFSGLEMKNKIKLVWIGYDDDKSEHIYKRREGCRVWELL